MVERAKEEHGLNRALEAIDLAKGTWAYHKNKKVDKQEKYNHLKTPLNDIVEENPEYGGRKIRAELQREHGYHHGRGLINELMRMWGLNRERQARDTNRSGYQQAIEEAGEQANLMAERKQIEWFEVVYTDFTELTYAGGSRKAQLMSVIGHTSKFVFGWAVEETRSTELALSAWERAVE